MHKVAGEPIVYSMPCKSKLNVQLVLLDDIKVNVFTNHDTGFTYKHHNQLGLRSLLPPAMQRLNTQVLHQLHSMATALEKYVMLASQRQTNTCLYYTTIPIINDSMRVWHKLDDRFGLPKANVFFVLCNPLISTTPAMLIRTCMLIKLISDLLIEYSYIALLAGLGYMLDLQDQ
ncbi:uncharacterized protein UDID_18844 [Ustilago sp. UG-2017a]|nr:uncharacterized protein UDID_18844 [Ustilago sp. UG-2017a]